MSPDEFLLKLFEEGMTTERPSRPISHWKNHCVNCGVLKGKAHVLDDCPPQAWEKL